MRCSIQRSGINDWIDLLAAFDAAGIRYLIVGGIAVALHGEPRYTKDLDVLVAVDASQESVLRQCLADFGAPVAIVDPGEFLQEDFVFHFGNPPWRIDILTSVPGINFDEAYLDRVIAPLGEYAASFISKSFLIQAKRASGRPQDLLDLEGLE